MTGGPEPISEVAREALRQDLADLHIEREKVAATLRSGDEVGDPADQADELQRATELDRLDRRIAEIDERLHGAAVAGRPSTDAVGVGSTVTVRFEDGTEMTVQVGEVAEALDETLVTVDSPLGHALLGHRAGDTVDYETPRGRTAAVVLSIGAEDGGV
ncbi:MULTISPECIES: GreA/GreB family elongation factor [unclassified Streptomyces]|uniref:GreA/GreB family elongation factor n=1 Tax=Streptomycetaceae TaxID=2062 RepID=UPI002E7A6340|nr:MULTISPECIES: GreA/GreB family elongation factor [unclassified Streptomyces]MED7952024.1 GreA/GreB family elongation factor [Streptomyces sp. BE303]MEE1821428.1 GreA/GreB family elongation factor [Streptomyces sp. BE20]